MTVIAGWHDAKQAWIGGDSGAFDESANSVVLTETKVWKTDGYLLGAFGAAGGFRLAEIAYESEIGDPHKLRDHLESWWRDSTANEENDTQFLVLSTNGVWIIDSDFAVIRCREHYGAIGAGSMSALSALFALEGVAVNGKTRITTALKATAYHNFLVRPPFKIVNL